METVFIDFKNMGIKASINKVDFNPAKHTLWSERKIELLKKPEKTSETDFDKAESATVTRPAKTRNLPK